MVVPSSLASHMAFFNGGSTSPDSHRATVCCVVASLFASTHWLQPFLCRNSAMRFSMITHSTREARVLL